MKKSFVKVIAAALTVSVIVPLYGCGKKEEGNKITMWSGDSHSKAVMTALVDEFNQTIGKENDIEFVYEVKDGTTLSNIDLTLENGEGPDLISGGKMAEWSEKGYIAPIESMPGSEEFLKRYEGNLVETWHTYKGSTYTVPTASTTMGLLYNKDMFKAAGIVDENGEPTPPETLEELREYAKRLTDKEAKQYGIIFPMKWSAWYDYDVVRTVMSSFGNMGFDPVTGNYDYTILKPMLQTIMDIKSDGSFYPGAENMENDAARARFADGNIGMKYGFSWDVGVLNDQFPAKCDWGVAELPVVDKNNKYKQAMQPSWAPYINKKSLEKVSPEDVMVVYKWLNSDETRRKLYEGGVYIPWDYSIVDGADMTKAKKGWNEFGDMVGKSSFFPVAIKTDTSSYEGMSACFFRDIWNGNGSIDEFLNGATKVFNDGKVLYKESHPEYDEKLYLKESWNIERKD